MKHISPTGKRHAQVYRLYREDLWQRCQGRCERPGCGSLAHDAHHVRKPRRRYPQYLVALCRVCHMAVDAATSSRLGRLVILWDELEGMLLYTFRWLGGREDGWQKSIIVRPLTGGSL